MKIRQARQKERMSRFSGTAWAEAHPTCLESAEIGEICGWKYGSR
jgi:hypothetical protein